MCGRYTLYSSVPELESEFDAQFKDEIRPDAMYNIPPGTYNPVVLLGKAREPGISLMKWGLVPPFAESEKMGFKLMNARSETIDEKPSFKKAFQRKRCLIPANGFFEWKRMEGSDIKIPFYISLLERSLFAFAGIFERWQSPQGEVVFTYSIITTTANSLLQPLHERMPVIIDKPAYSYWLNPMNDDYKGLKSLMKPYPTEAMSVFRVKDDVNKAGNNQPGIIAPVM
ncbi:MAG: SOS response-associated peptidase [Balneolales bacterium]|nr:SOS response-associated peptidase [Balneolales bacterium]